MDGNLKKLFKIFDKKINTIAIITAIAMSAFCLYVNFLDGKEANVPNPVLSFLYSVSTSSIPILILYSLAYWLLSGAEKVRAESIVSEIAANLFDHLKEKSLTNACNITLSFYDYNWKSF